MRLGIDPKALPGMPSEARFWINRDGERGDDPPPARDDASVYRVLVVGGSAAECYFLDQDASWPGVVQERLLRAENRERLGGRRAHVANLARSGTGPTEAVARVLERIRDRSRCDVILIMAGAADIVNWMRHGTPSEIPDELSTDFLFLQHPEKRFGWHPARLALVELLRRLKQRWSAAEFRREHVGKKLIETRAMRARAEKIKDDTPDPAPMIAAYESGLRRAVEVAKTMSERVLVVRQPWFEKDHTDEENARFWNCGEGYPYSEDVKTYFSMAVTARLMQTLSDVGARICEEAAVEHLDLMPTLDRSLRTYYDFFHFTAEGASDVADAVSEVILKSVQERA